MLDSTRIKAKDYILHVAIGSFALGIIIHFILSNGYTPNPNDFASLWEIKEIFLYAFIEATIATILFAVACKLFKKRS